MGKVVTFYSFKGGVGRSMGLANIGAVLGAWGYKVLLVDWDLEAPGLEYYFQRQVNLADVLASPGLIDLLHGMRGGAAAGMEGWRECVVPISLPPTDPEDW